MKNEQLLNAMEQIDDEYILAAASTITLKKSSNHKTIFQKLGVFAACFACCTIIYLFANHKTPDTTTESNLPVLEITFVSNDGMGYEGFMFYDISESDSNNPWNADVVLESLPIYKNLAYSDAAGTPICLSESKMKESLEQTAAAFNEEILEFHTDSFNENIYQVTATTQNMQITISGNATIKIEYLNPLSLPAEYSFTTSNTGDAEAKVTMDYLLNQYSFLLDSDSLDLSVWGDYSFDGMQNRKYSAYIHGTTLSESILNYNFKRISFVPNSQGQLSCIQLTDSLSCSELIGEYPIITHEAALKALLNGDYFTTVPEEYLSNGNINKSQIAKTELVYLTGNTNEFFIPYYRFYVELSEGENIEIKDGLKTYGIYYVAAVEGEYVKAK